MKFSESLMLLLLVLSLSAMITDLTFSIPSDKLQATVHTNKFNYLLREVVNISGDVKYRGNLTDRGWIGIQIRDTSSNIMVRTLKTGTGPMISDPVAVNYFYLSDSEGNPKTKFERGETAYPWIEVSNMDEIGEKNVTVTITLFDSDQIPLGFDYISVTIRPSTSILWTSSGVDIPEWATVGNTQAYVSVLSDFPNNDGYPYMPETALNYTIIESQFADLPTNTIPQQPIQNGTYLTHFRISPSPFTGTYQAYVCARYDGLYSWSRLATFRVNGTIATPPRASFTANPPLAGTGYSIIFYGGFSSAEGTSDYITLYKWDFGDGNTTTTGKNVTHSYAAYANYIVTLNVTDFQGLWNTTSRIVRIAKVHDVALADIQCSAVYADSSAKIAVEALNKGTFNETFHVTAYYNSSVVGTGTITNLGPYKKANVAIQWNTMGLPKYVYYRISAQAEILINETSTGDNTIVYGFIRTKGLGDIDGDRDVDIFDIVLIAKSYGAKSGGTNWNIQADLNADETINIFDLVLAAGKYGKKY